MKKGCKNYKKQAKLVTKNTFKKGGYRFKYLLYLLTSIFGYLLLWPIFAIYNQRFTKSIVDKCEIKVVNGFEKTSVETCFKSFITTTLKVLMLLISIILLGGLSYGLYYLGFVLEIQFYMPVFTKYLLALPSVLVLVYYVVTYLLKYAATTFILANNEEMEIKDVFRLSEKSMRRNKLRYAMVSIVPLLITVVLCFVPYLLISLLIQLGIIPQEVVYNYSIVLNVIVFVSAFIIIIFRINSLITGRVSKYILLSDIVRFDEYEFKVKGVSIEKYEEMNTSDLVELFNTTQTQTKLNKIVKEKSKGKDEEIKELIDEANKLEDNSKEEIEEEVAPVEPKVEEASVEPKVEATLVEEKVDATLVEPKVEEASVEPKVDATLVEAPAKKEKKVRAKKGSKEVVNETLEEPKAVGTPVLETLVEPKVETTSVEENLVETASVEETPTVESTPVETKTEETNDETKIMSDIDKILNDLGI